MEAGGWAGWFVAVGLAAVGRDRVGDGLVNPATGCAVTQRPPTWVNPTERATPQPADVSVTAAVPMIAREMRVTATTATTCRNRAVLTTPTSMWSADLMAMNRAPV
ncbi:MAG TPA: hypothetical protein VKF28_05810 [Candidatus Dormibacteraeota bacterium]|nr:hypothetical protein [Candidatus Dormibacteraeota bacterium]